MKGIPLTEQSLFTAVTYCVWMSCNLDETLQLMCFVNSTNSERQSVEVM